MTPHLKIKKVGRRKVDAEIDKFNSAIEQYISNGLLNSVFWDFRYSLHPELGSGVGSRGDALSNKTALLEKALTAPLVYPRSPRFAGKAGPFRASRAPLI